MRVICTAGHVDHGKSTLIKAISGINPDRLREEIEREMTIDLGFAWIMLPGGERVGIVDVPGHEDFIENMLAGIGGLDAALLIVAADEGVMPQTREHVAILELMGMTDAVVAITKIDMAESEEWIELVELDVMELLSGGNLADAPMVRVSAHTGEGLDELVNTLQEVLQERPPRIDRGNPVLPVDRVFTLSGFGTVVTGTLSEGTLEVGGTVSIQPRGLEARIRGLQSHDEPVEIAEPGSRVAVNLTGVDRADVMRGDVLCLPGTIHPTLLFDAVFDHLASAERPLKHNAQVKVFIGPSEMLARIRLLDADALNPGQTGYVQLQLESELPVRPDQRFVVRIPSPPETTGGGTVLDTAPGRKWKRNHPDVLERFDALAYGDPAAKLAYRLKSGRVPMKITSFEDRAALEEAIENYELVEFDGYIAHPDVLADFGRAAVQILSDFHAAEPLLGGMDPPELLRRLRLNEEGVIALRFLAEQGVIELGRLVKLPGQGLSFTKAQRQAIADLLKVFDAKPFLPPSFKDASKALGENILKALLAQDELIFIRPDVLLRPASYHKMVDYARQRLESGEVLTVAEIRDNFETSRRVALPFLDHLEAQGITRRQDDGHVLRESRWDALLPD